MACTYNRNLELSRQGEQSTRWKYMPISDVINDISQLSPRTSEKTGTDSMKLTNESEQGVFGFLYHTGPQSLSVSVPGDVVPIKFGSHTVLSGIKHEEQSADIVIGAKGVYEFSYTLVISAPTTVHAAFALQADGQNLPGSLFSRQISPEERVYGATVLAELNNNASVRLVMTSGTVLNAELTGSGVSASLIINKLN
jgi:hypothetical protein